ncbi:MAG TPA: hypothetical protein VJR89_15365 [Polyangiales bacterium]|nr:hypothetical protein [Polyangiales bacterium]
MAETLLPIFKLLVLIAVPFASFAIGLRASDPLWLVKRPLLLARSLLAILIVIPVVEVLLAKALLPTLAVRGGIVASILSIGIGPPGLLPRTNATDDVTCYTIGLNVVLMVLVVVYLPAAVALHGLAFGHQLSLPWSDVASVVLSKALLPFLAGLLVRSWVPGIAAPVARYAQPVVAVVLGLVVLVALFALRDALAEVGIRAWVVSAFFTVFAIAVGHFASGRRDDVRRVLATFSAMRFPALALLITSIVPEGRTWIPAALVYTLCSVILVGVYVAWLKKQSAPRAGALERKAV